MPEFVVCLEKNNGWGYWTGKTYTEQGKKYFVCGAEVNLFTMRYSSRKKAEKAARKSGCHNWRVEEIDSDSVETLWE